MGHIRRRGQGDQKVRPAQEAGIQPSAYQIEYKNLLPSMFLSLWLAEESAHTYQKEDKGDDDS
jgi:hypothetical protein